MSHDHSAPRPPSITTSRLETFCDGVFAIVITLLILEIRVPHLPRNMADLELLHHLVEMWPKYLSFGLSFVIVGIFWVAHHQIFHLVKRTDRQFLWINLLFLLCVTFIPFPTALMGEYVGTPIAVVPYGLTLIASGLMLALVWWYATHRRRLVSPALDDELVRQVMRRTLAGPALYAAAMLVSIVSARLTLGLYALIPLYFILPHARLDNHMAHHVAAEAQAESAAPGV